jgi:hypothetical protein
MQKEMDTFDVEIKNGTCLLVCSEKTRKIAKRCWLFAGFGEWGMNYQHVLFW